MKDNIEFSKFISELHEDVARLWQNAPPVIELRGWWWKKYIPHYRKMRDVMQELVEHKWREDYPEIRHMIDQKIKDEYKDYGKSFFN